MKKNDHKNQRMIDRRHFLRGAGGVTLALPFLPSLDILLGGSEANAQTASNIRRFVSILIKNGYFGAHYYPQIPANQMVRSTIDSNASIGKLPDNISAVLGAQFNPFKDTIVIPEHIDATCNRTGHNLTHTLSGMSSEGNEFLPPKGKRYSSIDRYIATVVNGTSVMKFKTLTAGIIWHDGPTSPSFYLDANGDLRYASYSRDVEALWTKLFGNQSGGINPGSSQQAQKASLVDLVLEDYKRLRLNSRLSQADRSALDAHIEQMNELEKRVKQVSAPAATCELVPKPSGAKYIASANQTFSSTRAMMDLVAMAFKCDLTRVATLVVDPDVLYREIAGYGYGHHDISHNTSKADKANILKIQQEQFSHVAYLMERLRAEGIYDSTLGLVHNEIGDQSASGYGSVSDPWADVNHECYNMQLLLFGLPNVLNGGHLVSYNSGTRGRWSTITGRSYSDFLLTVMQAMGVKPADYEIPGIVGYGSYTEEIWGQTKPNIVSPSSVRGKPLAGILKSTT